MDKIPMQEQLLIFARHPQFQYYSSGIYGHAINSLCNDSMIISIYQDNGRYKIFYTGHLCNLSRASAEIMCGYFWNTKQEHVFGIMNRLAEEFNKFFHFAIRRDTTILQKELKKIKNSVGVFPFPKLLEKSDAYLKLATSLLMLSTSPQRTACILLPWNILYTIIQGVVK